MHIQEFRGFANGILVFSIFTVFNLSIRELELLSAISSAAAVTTIILIAVTLLLGPLSRFFPTHFKHDLVYRKPLGLAGFFFALVHAVSAFYGSYNADLGYVFSSANPNFWPAIFAIISLIILGVLAITSTPQAIKHLTFPKWKQLQRLGYVALIFAVLHFVLVDNFKFLETITGKAVLALAMVAIFAKLVAMALDLDKAHSKKEIEHLMKE